MQSNKAKINICAITSKILFGFSNSLDTSATKAALANLRNSIGRPYQSCMEVWKIIFENLPQEYLGYGDRLSAEENALLNTLQLYAVHQQGKTESVNLDDPDCAWQNVGYALSSLRTDDNVSAVDRRFNVMMASKSFEGLCHHLRQLVKLLKAKSESKINYSKLANDLYWFLRGYEKNLRLDCSRQYYRNLGDNENGDNENENK